MAKPYMPLMVGDWLKGTRGMRADAKGVYLGLLLHQHEEGFIPNDLEQLALIEPEVGKVWVFIKDKFEEFEPGKLRNNKLVEVLAFWEKQGKNGSKGGRPKKENPNDNPKPNPNSNPNHNHHNDHDHDSDLKINKGVEEKLKRLDDIYLEQQKMKWPHLDFNFEYRTFCEKVRGSPEVYQDHADLRLAFQAQLRNAKPKQNVKSSNITKEQRDNYLRQKYGVEGVTNGG